MRTLRHIEIKCLNITHLLSPGAKTKNRQSYILERRIWASSPLYDSGAARSLEMPVAQTHTVPAALEGEPMVETRGVRSGDCFEMNGQETTFGGDVNWRKRRSLGKKTPDRKESIHKGLAGQRTWNILEPTEARVAKMSEQGVKN